MSTFDLDQFRQNLRETIAYCAPRIREGDMQFSLRSAPMPDGYPLNYNYVKNEDFFQQLMASVQEKRSIAADELALSDDDPLYGGRLLVYTFTAHYDHAAEYASNYFVDIYDAPPWDTWVYVGNDEDEFRYLIAWVPSEWIAYTQRAINARHSKSNFWLEDAYELSFGKILEQAGFFKHTFDFDLSQFQERLLQAIVWCQYQLYGSDEVGSLRQPFPDGDFDSIKFETIHATLTDFAKKQQNLLGTSQAIDDLVVNYVMGDDKLSGGRLLAIQLDQSAENPQWKNISGNFLDDFGLPPWDTWIHCDKLQVGTESTLIELLIAWIPPQWMDRVNQCINLSSNQSLQWLNEMNTLTIYPQLLTAGLLNEPK